MPRPLDPRARAIAKKILAELGRKARNALEQDLALHSSSSTQLRKRRIAPIINIPATGDSDIALPQRRGSRSMQSRSVGRLSVPTLTELPPITRPSIPRNNRTSRGDGYFDSPTATSSRVVTRSFSTSATASKLKVMSKKPQPNPPSQATGPLHKQMQYARPVGIRIHPSHEAKMNASSTQPAMKAEGSSSSAPSQGKHWVKSSQAKGPAANPEFDTSELERLAEEVLNEKPARAKPEKKTKEPPPHMTVVTSEPGILVSQGEISAKDINLETLDDGRNTPVAILRRNLQRVPFNPGIHQMRDPRTGVWNFDPDQLHDIPTPEEFAYDRTPGYFPPGEDKDLLDMATKSNSTYVGSTSTLTKAFSQIYFALSGNRAVDLSYLSLPFISERTTFTPGACLPACLTIGKGANGSIFVDNDKMWDSENVLTKYGVILEKMLTAEPDDFKRFLLTAPDEGVSEAERNDRGAFSYQKGEKLLMRSQLDCWDPRLPGTGVFDIKTRAALAIRHDRANWKAMSKYDISEERGMVESFEREYFDLIRSAMLKFSMQVRIGRMDGIFLAYHNTRRNIGFQYISLEEMDKRLFGSSEMGDSSFKLIVRLFESMMDAIVQCFPDQKVSVTIKQVTPLSSRTVVAYVKPVHWEGDAGEHPVQAVSLSLRNFMNGELESGAMGFSADPETRKSQEWKVNWTITKTDMDPKTQSVVRKKYASALGELSNLMWLSTPEGKSPSQMEQITKELQLANPELKDGTRWKNADPRIKEMRGVARASGARYEQRLAAWGEKSANSWDFIER